MIEIIAKKYAKAVIESVEYNQLDCFLENLRKISQVFCLKKFVDIIQSPYISKVDKQDLLLELIDRKYSNLNIMKNFIEILVQNNRIDIIPYVCDALQAHIDEKSNFYTGILYVNKLIKPENIEEIKKNLSKRLNIDLNIEQVTSEIEGVKFVIEDLDIEIYFSKEYFLNQLKVHILKAI
ncbi:hypothetical protein BKH42_05930 [Helicobacter sp. 13S00482-2]|uniref:F0F1 ATP synthase subunit delta n=1 Tax=Helicobacter sp. 13S00482-2 TaxID=1476200 RepID=UPI000BA559F9|nr:F0F1 ATP synthase subunit delta [Helicobacter sp. 13S00482-2]PAF53462.1 hypothetical protein BKH42_05930 [Helicobacter sp. 13S00482-2]